jgi:hypothetical protein
MRNGYMVVETAFVPRSVCFSLQSASNIENGAIVGKGDLVEGETSVYEAETDYTDGMYLVANPAWNYETYRATDQNEENYINKAGVAFRAYRLEKDMKFKVYNLDLETPFVEGDHVKFESGIMCIINSNLHTLRMLLVKNCFNFLIPFFPNNASF